ncbi:Na/Pi cotransporter family protein [Oribacterium sp. WCC10]|uniref:Na/Pi cotransporter family protein n=1 Tax=Oribacterium sp. WCC10 TaxID=1855343 RepID=UPI0008E1CA68|nr:Na/Pi cotransporter family protein [Oribacterium sp. WCC10]SFG06909.1 phosphate:Na+ symporter [Oribacterium sp. WCC10]
MITIFVSLLGGLGLFIAGMYMMSHGIEKVAGNKLRKILETFTRTRLTGVLVGLFFTAVIQSSSTATVMVVTFVNSGLMALSNACGIILGANIGTTVTALLVAFRLSAIAPLFAFAGAIMMNFIPYPTVKKSGEIVMGFGLLFLGISTMSGSMADLREIPAVISFLSGFTNPILGILMGFVITSIVQSSSVTVSILVVMGSMGLVDLRICMFIILGCNIGACSSAVLTALQGNVNAKRAALIHLLFNIFGTVLMFILLMLFSTQIEGIIRFVSGTGDDPGSLGRNIAFAHFIFKVFQVIVFYPFMDQIIALTYVLAKEETDKSASEDGEYRLKYINLSKLPNPAVAIYMAKQEMERMANAAFSNLNIAAECLLKEDSKGIEKVYETEKYIDWLCEQINTYMTKINQNAIPLRDADLISGYFHVCSDIERIGDHAEDIADVVRYFDEKDVHLSDEGKEDLKGMIEVVNKLLRDSLDMFVTGDMTNMEEVRALEDKTDELEITLQDKHVQRLSDGRCSVRAGVFFSDLVSGIERVGDHAINIAFSLSEAKNRSAARA